MSLGKKLLLINAAALTCPGTINLAAETEESGNFYTYTTPENIIFLIGDGMGIEYVSAYRYLQDDARTAIVDDTAFDPYLTGMQSTHADDPEANVTDSAAAATAMAAGVKTYNSSIAVDNDRSAVQTVLEAAKAQGKATGLVVTSEVTHATPAAFAAHVADRQNMRAIADDYYDDRIDGAHKIDVLFGGGRDLLIRSDRNLVEEFQTDGYSYVDSRVELRQNRDSRVVGLFADRGLPYSIDRTNDVPSLAEMTESAIERLSRDDDGFFLLVEGSQIDWAGHDNDIVAAMSEMADFEQAFQTAIDFAQEDGDTLVIATADHSVGGLSVGADGYYDWDGDSVRTARRTPDFIAREILTGADVQETLDAYIGIELRSEEIAAVRKAARTEGFSATDDAIEAIFDARSHTGWTTDGHTGEDVPVYAAGPGRTQFAGHIDNTDIAKKLFRLLGADADITDE
ncbi:alkaline phosphatase [Planococcus lenghuensis]